MFTTLEGYLRFAFFLHLQSQSCRTIGYIWDIFAFKEMGALANTDWTHSCRERDHIIGIDRATFMKILHIEVCAQIRWQTQSKSTYSSRLLDILLY